MRQVIFPILAVGALAACEPLEMPDEGEGAAAFAANCAMCHGADGKGDGPLAGDLDVPPQDLTRLSRETDGTFPVNRVLSYVDGYTRSDREHVQMPEFGLLLEGPSVPIETGEGVFTPTPRPLAALLAYLESIQE